MASTRPVVLGDRPSLATTSHSVKERQEPLGGRFDGGDGTDGDDVIVNATYSNGLGGSDTIRGSAGDDWISGYFDFDMGEGLDGGDFIRGGIGADFVVGGAGGDTLWGDEGSDSLYGASGGSRRESADVADTLDGGEGDDVARGNHGDDLLRGGAGDDNLGGQWDDDVLDGGAGYDMAAFYMYYEPTGMKFNASAFRPDATIVLRDGMGGRDTLVGIDELIITGTAFNDTLVGSSVRDRLLADDGDNLVDAGRGDDTLSSFSGSSTLAGGEGDDRFQIYGFSSRTSQPAIGRHAIDGGEGFDVLTLQSLLGNAPAVVATLDSGGILTLEVGQLAIDAINIEALSLVGATGDDWLAGGNAGDWLGGAPDNTGLPTDGDDTLVGGGGDDTLVGGFGDNRIDGGEGHDIYVWQPIWVEEGEVISLDASTFDVSGGTFTYPTEDGTDTVSGIEGVGLYGSYGADTLVGSAGGDRLEGGEGADSISAGDGDDLVVLAYAPPERASRPDIDETIRGGAGFDTLDFDSMGTGLIVDLRQGRMGYVRTQGDRLKMLGQITGMEGVIGGDHADVIRGGRVSEALWGREGDDTLTGGNGKDTLAGGIGADKLDGGARKDLFIYSAIEDSSVHAADLITGYAAEDRIDLHAIDANWSIDGDQAFTLVKTFDGHAGQLAVSVSHDVTSVFGDVDGDGAADFRIDLDGNHKGQIAFVL